jgi:hypothetical protein
MVPLIPDDVFSTVSSAITIRKWGIAALQQAIRSRDAAAAEAACVAMEGDQAAKVASILRQRGVLGSVLPEVHDQLAPGLA